MKDDNCVTDERSTGDDEGSNSFDIGSAAWNYPTGLSLLPWEGSLEPSAPTLKRSTSHESIFSTLGVSTADPQPMWKISAGGTALAQVSVEKMHATPVRSTSVTSKTLLSAAVSQGTKRSEDHAVTASDNKDTEVKSWASSLFTRLRGAKHRETFSKSGAGQDSKEDHETIGNDDDEHIGRPTNAAELLAEALAANL
jgi:hypothetical protein